MQTQFPDLDHPFYGPEELAGDVWASYRRKIFKNVDWRLQLNVRNLIEDGRLQPVSVNPDGSGWAFRIIDPRQSFLTATFNL